MNGKEIEELSETSFNIGTKRGTLDTLKELSRYLEEVKPTNEEIIEFFILPKLKQL